MPLANRLKIIARHVEATASNGKSLYTSASVLLYHASCNRFLMTPPRWGMKSTTTSNHPSTPDRYNRLRKEVLCYELYMGGLRNDVIFICLIIL